MAPEELAELLALRREVELLRAAQPGPQAVPAWLSRQRRLDARDAALREALSACVGMGANNAARRVARAWRAALQGLRAPEELAAPLARATAAHGDAAALGWHQIARIGREGRTPGGA